MPIPLPDLDDRTFADLVAEATELIPRLAPEWTDHNPSDPGIALVELLAWLTEMLLFEVNEIPPSHTELFLRLLNGPDWTRPERTERSDPTLADEVRATMRTLREPYRAVTAEDYEYLVRNTARLVRAQLDSGGTEADDKLLRPLLDRGNAVRRVTCVPGRNARGNAAPGHVSVVVLPQPADADGAFPHPMPARALTRGLVHFLDERRMLATQVHVVAPDYVQLGVEVVLALREDAPPRALDDVVAALRRFLNPVDGGHARDGWPFGRSVHASEVSTVVEQAGPVDHVESVRLTRYQAAGDPGVSADEIGLDAHQLVKLVKVTLAGYDARRNEVPSPEWTDEP